MAQKASSISSPSISGYTYDVFLSFRGEDTRYGFTGNLYSALSQRGIFTFIDDEALQKGEEITPSLHKAIQESRISIIIFSKKYATSTFCLNELVLILECYIKQNMLIFPVFYDIDPSHVRHQTGSYKEAFAMHEWGRFKDDTEKVQKWRLALHLAANLSGWHFKIGEEYESVFIKKITEEVSSKLNRRPLHIANYPVGLQARIQQIQRLIGAEYENKVTVLGIHGMGGIGKSTLARAIYNSIAYQFESSCFVANVREKSSTKHGLVKIQKTMLSELVGQRDIKLGDVNQGIPLLQHRLCRKKILLVVDDIDKKEQLEATAGGLDWFGHGSIIIITTRDKKLLNIHGVEKLYEVNELDDTDAFELLTRNAFKNKEVDPNYMELIERATYYASGLPLVLEMIGSNLSGKTLDEWDSALKEYQRNPNRDVHEILRISYDSLADNEKEIFLDIACIFRGYSLAHVTNILEARGLHLKFHIRVLEEKSFIKIDRYNGEIVMHDLIRSMGREIVRQQSTGLENQKRLWFYDDIVSVLEKNKENNEIEAMLLVMPEDQEVQWNQKAFGNLKNLRMLFVIKNDSSVWSPKVLPNSLEVLEWHGYPATSLPSKFQLKNLFKLDLSDSYFRWDKPLQNSKVLRCLHLVGCQNVRRIPDISSTPNLTELIVSECTNLIEIHDSVGLLHNLQLFYAEGCSKLKIAPRGLKMTSLKSLSFRDCSSLVIFPEILSPMLKLKNVRLDGTAIKKLPLSMKNLEALQMLSLTRCKMLESNEPLNFIQKLPEFFPNLKELYLHGSNLTILPACIEDCLSLQTLDVSNCKQLKEIKGLPPSIIHFSAENTALEDKSLTLNMLLRWAIDSTTMIYSVLPSHRIPEWFDHISREKSLHFWFRNELPSLTMCAVSGVLDNTLVQFDFFIKMNDINVHAFNFFLTPEICPYKDDHIIIINLKNCLPSSTNFDIEEALKINDWNSGEVSVVMTAPEEVSCCLDVIKWTGVYVNRTFSKMENVRFTDPYPPNNSTDVGNQFMWLCEAGDIQQQEQSLAFYNPTIPLDSEIGEQPWNCVHTTPDSQEVAWTIDFCTNQEFLYNQAMVPSFAAAENVNAHGEMRTQISEVPWEFTHQTRDYMDVSWEQSLALFNPTLTIPLGSEIAEEPLSYEGNNSYSHEPVWTVECSNDQDEAFMYNQATVPSFAEMENASPHEPFMHNQEKVPSFVETKNASPDEALMYNQAMVSSFAENKNVNAEGEMGTLMSEVSRQFIHRSKDYTFNYILGETLMLDTTSNNKCWTHD